MEINRESLKKFVVDMIDNVTDIIQPNDKKTDAKLPKQDYAVLKMYVNKDNKELCDLYDDHVKKHNEKVSTDDFPNAGFDLFVPKETRFEIGNSKSVFIDLEVKCEMILNNKLNSAYYMYPRSSMSKTSLILSNHTGIVDSGYRGNLIGAFRNVNNDKKDEVVEKHTRLLQICHPTLCPILVKMVDEDELSTTSRGSGGFGSTGNTGILL